MKKVANKLCSGMNWNRSDLSFQLKGFLYKYTQENPIATREEFLLAIDQI